MALFFESKNYHEVARWQGIMLACGLHPEIYEHTGKALQGGDPETDTIAAKLARNAKGTMGIAVPQEECGRVSRAHAEVKRQLPALGVFDSEERQRQREELFVAMIGQN